MKRIISSLAVAMLAAALSGCMGGAMVKKDGLAQTRRIAVVSVVMPRFMDLTKDNNRNMIQGAIDRALGQAEANLRSMGTWSVIDAAGFKSSTAVMSFTAVAATEVAALLPEGAQRASAVDEVVKEVGQWKTAFLGAKGLPIIPRYGIVPSKGDTVVLSRVQALMQRHAAKVCGWLNVDAVAFVYLQADISHPRPKTFIVTHYRTDGMLRAVQTIVIVDKKGTILADMGWPNLDEHAKSRDLLPVYVGSGEQAVKPENIDLIDPRNKIPPALSSLIDETSADMIAALKKAM